MMNDYKVLNQRKNGNKTISSPNDISQYILNINVDRRSGTNINECKLTCDGIPYINGVPLVRKSITNSRNVITDPMDKMQILINGKIQFTGWLVNYKISSDNQQVELTLHDNGIILKRGLNAHPMPKVTYKEVYNTTVIAMLAGIVGVTVNLDPKVIEKAVLLKEYTIENGQNIYDAIVELCKSLDAVIMAQKDGTMIVKPVYLEYTSGFDFKYDEVEHITAASTTISTSMLKPTILVKNESDEKAKKSWVFTDKEMLNYLNSWDDVEVIDSDLAINKDVARNMAHERICTMWRSATTQDIVAADGNIDMDVDKVIQTTIDDDTDVYRVIGMTTVFNEDEGFIDQLTLECIHPHNVEFLGDMIDCKGMRDAIVAQAIKYVNVPFHPDMYYRTDEGEWGMKDEALITHTLIDVGIKGPETLTTSQPTIKNEWCYSITKDQLQAGDIVTWPNDQKEMGFYIGNNKIIEVWGSVISNMTPTAMKYKGYFVKVILMDDAFGVVNPECWRLKELESCG
ncbi:hypothetical protein psyc5s11_29990 [Clostridium gelidum]|uniref:NlpC/P60 family protein n=1 Tax=Clostridium gelidum TaxID=704125 RepID=A0ABN6IY94_9CLOT|nr:peptidoglycan endopeptidase [Clostridium gelidum]BCZ46932.1 hypothetical protein psyc5s11_29990 [Clostridium gelidum]